MDQDFIPASENSLYLFLPYRLRTIKTQMLLSKEFNEEYDFVVMCTICSIRCKAKSPQHFFPVMLHSWEKASFIDENIALRIKHVASHCLNHFFISDIQSEHKVLLLCVFWIFLLAYM
mgnify:FL=1